MKRVGWYHCFPFEAVKKGQEIIIWGMGEVGHHYVKQIQMTGYCKIAYAVDINWKHKKNSMVRIFPPIHVKDTPDITVVIANGDGNVVSSIQEQLKEWNIKHVIWKDYIIGQNMVVDDAPISQVYDESKDKNIQQIIRRVPYLKGGESGYINRSTPYQLAAHIFKGAKFYDVISFDIFGTAVFLPFAEECTLYYILENLHGVKGFAKLREEAEVKAHKQAKLKYGKAIITLKDIYIQIYDETGIDVSEGVRKEEETLLKYCITNSYILDAYNLCTGKGRKLVFVSDTYYSKKIIEKILRKCGYSEWDELFLYNTCGCGEKSGEVYNLIRTKYGKKQNYYHIDDDAENVRQAQEKGYGTTIYHNVNLLGNPYRSSFNGMSYVTGSIYSGLVNIHLYRGNDGEKYSLPYEFGFVYGGIQILGFMQWVCYTAKAKSVEKILFLSEAGDIYQNVYSKMMELIPGEQMLWSNAMSAKLLARRRGYIAFLDYIKALMKCKEGIRVRDIVERLSLHALVDDFEEYYLYLDDILDDIVLYKLNRILKNKWNELSTLIYEECELAKQYIQGMVGEAKKIALVDMGMDSSQAIVLQAMISEEWKLDVKVICLLEGVYKEDYVNFYSGEIESENLVNAYIKYSSGNDKMNIYYRMLHATMTPGLCGFYVRDDKISIKLFRSNNYERKNVEGIQEGIMKFCRLWTNNAMVRNRVLNISSNDADIPFKTISKFDDYFTELG